MPAPRLFVLAALLPLAASCAPPLDPAARAANDQRELAAYVGARTPGTPQRCISTAPGMNMEAVGDALVARWGSRVWVNHVDGNCRAAASGNAILVTEPDTTNQYCENTPVRAVSSSGGMMMGSCVLGPWVPYN